VPLIYLSCAWVAGVLLGSKFNLSLALILSGLTPLLLLFFSRQHKKLIILASLCLFALFGGAFCFQSSLPADDQSCLHSYNNQTVTIKGMVNTDPEVGDKTTHLRLSTSEIKPDKEWQTVSGTALLFVPRYPTYSYGDVLLVTGKLETPPQLDDFDYKGYLAHQEIYSTMLYPKIEIIDRGKGSKPLEWVYSLRNNLSQTLASVLPEPQASLAQGIVLGIRGNIPPPVKEAFTHSGTAHILAISGLHLSIVAGIMLSLGIWLFGRRRYTYIWLAIGTIWLYALLTGMRPPVLRAAIMVSLFLATDLLGRQRSGMTSLAFAAAVMIGITPPILWNASFQLTFLAMAGLIFLAPPFQATGRKAVKATLGEEGPSVSISNFITDSFSITLAAIVAVWPIIAFYFGIVSFVTPLATFLALPALPGIIITGALTGGVGLFALPVAQVIAWLVWLFASYMLLVVNGFATLPLSFTEMDSVDTTLIGVYYLVLVTAIYLTSHQQKLVKLMPQTTDWLKSAISKSTNTASRLPMKWVIPPLLVLAILASVAAATMPDDKLHVNILDVGEGDAILISQGSQQTLIDGGPDPNKICLELGKEMPFWDRTIELVVLTHPEADHITGLVEVLQRYQVEQVMESSRENDTEIYREWQKLIEENRIKQIITQAGQQIDLGHGITMGVLHPQEELLEDTGSELNNNSIVLHLVKGKVSFLLTGDIEQEAEFELIARRAHLRSTMLKVAHHGSDTSTTPEFLAVVNPQLAVISAGENNPFGHPSHEVINRVEERLDPENIFCTTKHSTIEFITDGERLWVKTEK